MTSSDSEDQQTPRKRSRRSNSGDDGGAGGKKARGRPRVDTQDATAADRRRTQIRLAQRAYRQRKETTISSLKNQSTQLHSMIEQMNKTFLQLNESTTKSGLLQINPALAQEFKLAAETFANLVKTASEGQYEGEEDGEQGDQGAERNGAQKPAEPESETQHVGWGYFTASGPDSQRRPQQQLSTPDGYFAHISATYGNVDTSRTDLVPCRVFPTGAVFDQSSRSSQPPVDPPSSHTSSQPAQLPFGLVQLLGQQQTSFAPSNPQIYSVRIPTPDVTPPVNRLPTPPSTKTLKSLRPVATYSFEEATFARRLTRASLETGFQLLNRAEDRPTAVQRVFKLSLPHQTLEQLRNRLRTIMSRTIDEDLDWLDSPFIHIGGAGTHYPRRDAAGNLISVKGGWNVKKIGPPEKTVYITENTEDGRREEWPDVDLSGFEGEWFDCHDVQGYLEEKYACKFEPRSSFVECVIDQEDEGLSGVHASAPRPRPNIPTTELPRIGDRSDRPSTASSNASTIRPGQSYNVANNGAFGLDMSFGHTSDFPKLVNYDISFDQTLGLDLAPGYNYDFSHSDVFPMGDMDLGMNLANDVGAASPMGRAKRKSAWIDISRLIDEIIVRGVCLGRSPGFRRKDVDLAVRKALVLEH